MNTDVLRKLLVASVSTLSLGIAAFVLLRTDITLAKWSGLLWFLAMGLYLFAAPMLGLTTYLGGALIKPTDHPALRLSTILMGAACIVTSLYFFLA